MKVTLNSSSAKSASIPGETIVDKFVSDGKLRIIAKPNSPKTEIIGHDEARDALRVNVHAAARENEANIEIIKFFRKLLKKKVGIVSGFKGKEKILRIY